MRYLPVCLALFLSFSAKADTDPGWLAFGDLRGNIESCGCDPRTDLGGLQRLATLVFRERSRHTAIKVFSLGNNIDHLGKDVFKSEMIIKGISAIAPDVALLNYRELQTGLEHHSAPYYILSNSRRKSTSRYKELDSLIVFGFVEPSAEFSATTPWNHTLEKFFKTKLLSTRNKRGFLLYSGSTKTLRQIEKTSLFYKIISSNSRHNEDMPTAYEKDNPEFLSRTESVMMVPLKGAGVLRGGFLRNTETKSLLQLAQMQVSEQYFSKRVTSAPNLVSWLDHRYDSNALSSTITEYNKGRERQYLAKRAIRLEALKDTPFGGASKCQLCHRDQFAVWSKTKHATALETLELKKKDFVGECVKCHVLGLEVPGGFVSRKDTPNFAGVQCENCHGAQLQHSKNPSVKPKQIADKEKLCQSCHHDPHTADFTWDKYWPKIAH